MPDIATVSPLNPHPRYIGPPTVRNMAYPWWVYILLVMAIFLYFALRQYIVHVSVRRKIINSPIPQQAGVIPMPTGSHSYIDTKVLCSATTLSGRPQPQNPCTYIYNNTRLPFGGGYVAFSSKKAIILRTYYEEKLSHVQVKIRSNPTANEERYSNKCLVVFRCRRG